MRDTPAEAVIGERGLGEHTKLVETFGLAVLGWAGGVAQVEHLREELAVVELPGRRIGSVDAGLDEVPVVVEARRDPAPAPVEVEPVELTELDQPAAALGDPARRVGVVEDAIEQRLPALLEREMALELVEHGEARREPGCDREVVEEAASEGVERADRGVVEACGVVGEARVDERRSHAVAQFGRRLLGERDGGDRSDVDAVANQRHDARDETRGLARTGAGLDEEVGPEVGGDALACRLIEREVERKLDAAHDGSSAASSGPNQRARRGSRCLWSHSA